MNLINRFSIIPLLLLAVSCPVMAEAAPEGMVWIPAGEFRMGSDDARFADAQPVHSVWVDGFWMDKTEVTNEQFGTFVEATKYLTVAERKPRQEDFPTAPPESLVPGSIVFTPPDRPVPLTNYFQWWAFVKGASWQHPEGPDSNIKGRETHPVVHVAYEDAEAYAKWAHKRLPTEAEFERASRGGLDQNKFAWGNELKPDGKSMANTFQGHFPENNTAEDGYKSTAPVGSFPGNGYGLFDMSGNVWQWCSDWYNPRTYEAYTKQGELTINPMGPKEKDAVDPQEPGVKKRVQRGGSFLCCDQYCSRYMAGARGQGEPSTSTNHVGFRCVKSSNE